MSDEHLKGQPLITIGGSAGSIEPLTTIIRALPQNFATPIFVVIHSSRNSRLSDVLQGCRTVPAVRVINGEEVRNNRIYLANADHHLTLTNSHIFSPYGPKENRHRPAIDPFFRSAAAAHATRVIGVLLSGMMDDGAAGLLAIKRGGGITIVQDPATAMQPSMPRAAIALLQNDYILPPSEIGPLLVKLTASGEEYARSNEKT